MSKKPVAWMKVYDPAGNYVASCVAAEAGAALMSLYGKGAEIRNGHSKKNAVWREGFEEQLAGESYDFVALIVADRTTTKDQPLSEEEQRRYDRAQEGLEQARATVRRVLASTQ
ncbi:hypothetical protein [Pseudomonas cannabina]|uniref:hypothetical protein n=1 Tax=Pseudomonas cannabina TaxID=86840 RepID=UPI0011C46F48|nr:hypothetical protein [Pseudomonas cannabina]